jgi:ubiquinone/menaquinone biosynthesis C-methylase UbiE
MFMDPLQTLSACNIQASSTVADFGAGSGFVARAVAKLVPQGQVFAIEINHDIVTRLTRDAADHHHANLHALWGDIEATEGSKLAHESVDMVICFNILFLLDDKAAALKEAFRVLKTGGRIVVADWTESFGGLGPQPHHIFNKTMAESLLTSTGFKKLSGMLPIGAHHYAILFAK